VNERTDNRTLPVGPPGHHAPAMPKLTWPKVLAWRLDRQFLASRSRDPHAVVRNITGLHAQVMSSAELTLWARVDDLAPDAVSRALWEEKTLVKTWAQRGTLHLLNADELGLWVGAQSALKPRHHVPAWLRYHGLDREHADAMLDAIPQALDGQVLTREALATEVARITGIGGLDDKLRGGFGDLLKPAAFRGDLCFAPNDGRNVRFARPDQWLGPWEPVEQDEAVLEVCRRYLAAYGPATREALQRWFGMSSSAQAGRWLKGLGNEAATVTLDGEGAVMLAADVDAVREAKASKTVRLLPAFDHYTVAAPRDRDAVLLEAHRARVYRPQGWLSPVLLVGGVMAGVWASERKGDRLEVEIEPFDVVTKAVRAAAEKEAAGLAAFLGGEADVRWV